MERLLIILYTCFFLSHTSTSIADTSTELIQATSSYIIAAGETITLPTDEVLLEGLVALSFDGDTSPGSLLLQVYRKGTNNGAWPITTPLNWKIGTTSDPGTGAFRLWIEGNNDGDRLVIRNTASYARAFSVYNFATAGENTFIGELFETLELSDAEISNAQAIITVPIIKVPIIPGDNTIAAGQTIYIENDDVIDAGPIIISVSDTNTPGSASFQIYRKGNGFNGVSALAQTGNWGVGDTSEPTTGDFRIWIENDASNARLAIKNNYTESRDLRVFSLRPYNYTPNDDFYMPAQSAVYLPGKNTTMAGLAFISMDGDKSPASAIVQVYRYGTYNGVWSLGQNGSWTMSKTSQASTGSYRMWVDGNDDYARLILKAYSSWGRNFRVYNFEP